MWLADSWKDYEVLDTSAGEKLVKNECSYPCVPYCAVPDLPATVYDISLKSQLKLVVTTAPISS